MVESMIRQVIDMRLQSVWKLLEEKENAQAMLCMRS